MVVARIGAAEAIAQDDGLASGHVLVGKAAAAQHIHHVVADKTIQAGSGRADRGHRAPVINLVGHGDAAHAERFGSYNASAILHSHHIVAGIGACHADSCDDQGLCSPCIFVREGNSQVVQVH